MVAAAAELDYLPPFEEASSLEVEAEPFRYELLGGLLGVDTDDTDEQLRHVAGIAVVDIAAAGMTVVDTAVDTCLAAADTEAHILVEVHILVAVVGKGRDC